MVKGRKMLNPPKEENDISWDFRVLNKKNSYFLQKRFFGLFWIDQQEFKNEQVANLYCSLLIEGEKK